MGRIDKNFLDDGFKVTYHDGVVERFHKNFLDDNYKGDKGSAINSHWIDDGFTVNKFDGTKESFHIRDSNEFLAGDKGTRIKEGFWGDYYVSENPYAGYRPPTIADARKAKYQETPIRAYTIDRNGETTLEELRNDLLDIIEAAGLQVHISGVDVRGNSAIAIVSNTNASYMPVCVYFTAEGRENMIVASVSGKGLQTNAADLSKLFYKAASPWGKLQIKASSGGAMATYFGYSVRAGGAIGGISALAGFAIGGGFKIAAKGLKALLRDNESYQKEMDFYNQATGIIDYTVGYNDSYGLLSIINERAGAGLPVAQYQMGIAHVYGIGVEANEDKAIEWFDKAAEGGELRSQNIIAGEYLYNNEKEYSREQKEKGIDYLYNLASFGEDWAGQLIIDIYGRGTVDGIELDYDEAIRVARIYSEYNALYSAEFLAPIYDTVIPPYNEELNKYKNDELAFQEYSVIAAHGEEKDREAASLKLAEMAQSGRGTEQSDEESLRHYRIASDCGNVLAKAILLHAYTYGEGVEKSKKEAEKYANEIIRGRHKQYIPEAYFSLFRFADEEARYGESIRNARNYLESSNADPEKRLLLETYLGDMDAKLSNMTEDERRVFLKEPRKFSSNSNYVKWILIACAVIGIILIGVFVMKNLMSEKSASAENVVNSFQEEGDDIAYSPGRYNDYDKDFVLPGSDERYIDESEISELSLDDTQMAINEIYARHGRIFKDEPYASHFDSCEWFVPTYSANEFDDSWFNKYERKNIESLAEHRDQKDGKTNKNVFSIEEILSEEEAISYVKKYVDSEGLYDTDDIVITCDDYYDGGYQVTGYDSTQTGNLFSWKVVHRGYIYDNDNAEWIVNDIEDLDLFDETEWEWSRNGENYKLTFHQDGTYSVSYTQNGLNIEDAYAGDFYYRDGFLSITGRYGPDEDVKNERYGSFSVNGFSGLDGDSYIVMYER